MISLLLGVHLLGSDFKRKMAGMHSEPCFMNLLCLLHSFSWKCNCFGITGIMEGKHTIKRVSCRVGKGDEVNLSWTESLRFCDSQLLGNCFNLCQAREVFYPFLLLLLLLNTHMKGQMWCYQKSDGSLKQYAISKNNNKFNYHINIITLIFGGEKTIREEAEQLNNI